MVQIERSPEYSSNFFPLILLSTPVTRMQNEIYPLHLLLEDILQNYQLNLSTILESAEYVPIADDTTPTPMTDTHIALCETKQACKINK